MNVNSVLNYKVLRVGQYTTQRVRRHGTQLKTAVWHLTTLHRSELSVIGEVYEGALRAGCHGHEMCVTCVCVTFLADKFALKFGGFIIINITSVFVLMLQC